MVSLMLVNTFHECLFFLRGGGCRGGRKLIRFQGGVLLLLAEMMLAIVSAPHCIWSLLRKPTDIVKAFKVKIVTLCLLPCGPDCVGKMIFQMDCRLWSLIGGVKDT